MVTPEKRVSQVFPPSNVHKNDTFLKKNEHEARKPYIAIRYINSVVSYGIICVFWNTQDVQIAQNRYL